MRIGDNPDPLVAKENAARRGVVLQRTGCSSDRYSAGRKKL